MDEVKRELLALCNEGVNAFCLLGSTGAAVSSVAVALEVAIDADVTVVVGVFTLDLEGS
jgi:hypothetical protein